MLSKCANPACPTLFRYLHEGRIFSNLEIAAAPPMEHDWEEGRLCRVEFFWLCGSCAKRMTLELEHGAMVLRPLHPGLQAEEPRLALPAASPSASPSRSDRAH